LIQITNTSKSVMKVTILETTALGLLPASGWFVASILKMEATCFSETSVDFFRTTRRNLQEIELSVKIECGYFIHIY
jgi:hypothetical protein